MGGALIHQPPSGRGLADAAGRTRRADAAGRRRCSAGWCVWDSIRAPLSGLLSWRESRRAFGRHAAHDHARLRLEWHHV